MLCMCVCFVLFFEAISSTSSFLLHERHMKSYIYTLANYKNLPGTHEMSDGMLAPV